MIIYAFDLEIAANAGAKKRFVNYVKDVFSKGEPVRDDEGLVTTLEGLTDEQISQLKVCSYRDGKVDLTEGLTTSYSNVRKARDHENWYFLKLEGEYMDGVVDYTEMELPESWKPIFPI